MERVEPKSSSASEQWSIKTMAGSDAESSESQQEDLPESKEALSRKNNFHNDFYLMRYGEVSPDHPAYDYVREIINKLPGTSDLNIKLRIIPDKFQSNAFATPDGTIVLTSRLLEFSEYYESLAGAVAHEKVHIEKEHAKQDQTKAPKDYKEIFEAGLKKLGKRRLNEYEADLRSAFGDLEEAGINPLGLKILLQKFAQRETYDDVHGDSMDRALNIATGSYLMDLKSLSADLVKIPPELIDSLKRIPPSEFGALFSRPKDYPGIFKPYSQRIQERREAISRISTPDQLLVALSTVGSYTKERNESGYDLDDETCLEGLVRKSAQLVKEKLSVSGKQSTSLILSYFSSLPPKKIEKYLTAEESVESVPAIVAAFNKAKESKLFGYALSQSPHFCSQLLKYLGANNTLRKEDTEAVRALDDSFYALNSVYGTSSPIKGELILSAERVFGILPKTSVEETQEVSSMWDKVKVIGSPKIFEFVRRNFPNLNVDTVHRAVPKLVKNLTDELKGKSPKEVMSALSDVNSVIREFVATVVFQTRRRSHIFDESTDIIRRYVVLKLFSQLSKKLNLPQFMERKQYYMYRLLFAYEFKADTLKGDIRIFLDRFTPREEGRHDQLSEYDEFSEDQDFVEDALQEIEQENLLRQRLEPDRFFSSEELEPNELKVFDEIESEIPEFKFGEENLFQSVEKQSVVDAYKIFVDPDYRKENNLDNLNFDPLSHAVKGRDFFVRLVDVYSTQITLPEFINFINDSQKEFEHFVPTLHSRSRMLGNINLKIADICKAGTLWGFPLKDIVTLSNFIDNPFIRNEVLSKGFSENWHNLPFDEKSSLLFPEKGQKGIVNFELRERFLCEEVRTKEQYEKIKKAVERSIEDLFSSTSVGMGGAVLADRITFKYSDPVRFLQSSLVTSSGDQTLRDWIDDFAMSATHVLDADDFETISDRKTDFPDRFITEKVIQQLYTLDEIGRRMFVRKLLVGTDGLLRTEENRRRFFDSIFESWLKNERGQEDLSNTLERIKESLVKEPSWELLYFAIQGILADKMFIPPRGAEGTEVIKAGPISRSKSYERQSEKVILSAIRMRKTLTDEGVTKERKQKITPVEFVKETAGNLGALGRRFLQVLPQFVELSPEYEKEFSDVYDKVAGQSKFAAIATAEREWPEMWNELKEIGERVGGGSIVTVYHSINKDGRDEVLKVRNPNILYHLEEAQKVALSVAGRLSDQYGEAYKQARDIIPDIHTWVTNDVNFEDFIQKDAQFRRKYQGFSVPENEYRIRIPESYGPQNPYFSREEYLPGINLTSIDDIINSKKHDAKQVIGLLAKFYIQQIMDGRLHSDIHPGNFAVTDNKELIVYDRNYYIDLSEWERTAILSLFNPFISEEQKIEGMRDLLQLKNETTPFLKEFVRSLSAGDIDKAKKEIIKIKSSGIEVPLNVTLLLKNISSIQSLAKKVGFFSIFEAVF